MIASDAMGPILGISTSSGVTSVAVWAQGRIVSHFYSAVPNAQAEQLGMAMKAALRAADIVPRDVEAVAVDVGPGSFTGLRAGIAAAKAFCMAVDVPAVPCPSSWSLYREAALAVGDEVAVVLDAKRGEVFWSVFPPDPAELGGTLREVVSHGPRIPLEQQMRLGIEVGAPCDAASVISRRASSSSRAPVVVGDGAILHRAALESVLANKVSFGPAEAFKTPTAVGACMLAAQLAALEGSLTISPDVVGAIYLRKPDVTATSRRHDAMVSRRVLM